MNQKKSKCVKLKRNNCQQQLKKRKIIDRLKMGRSLMLLRGERTQVELAQALNISDSAIRMYESGSRTPEDDTKIAYCEFFKKTVDELFFSYLVEVDNETHER